MDWRWIVGAGLGLMLAAVFAWVAAPGTPSEPLPQPVEVPTAGREKPTGKRRDGDLATSRSEPRPGRKRARSRAMGGAMMRPGAPMRTPDERRAFQDELTERVQSFGEEQGLELAERRELRRILRQLDRANRDIDRRLATSDKPEKWARATGEEVRVKVDMQLVDLLGPERADAAHAAFADMLDPG